MNYDTAVERFTTTLQQQIESSSNYIHINVHKDKPLKIFQQIYVIQVGNKNESVQSLFFQLDNNSHLNCAALSQENQLPVRAYILDTYTKSFLSRFKLKSKLSFSSVTSIQCISIAYTKTLFQFLVRYLKKHPV